MLHNKHDSLKKVYYRSFILLIVIPILLVFISALYVVNIMIRNSAISNIKSAQSTIVSSLTEDIRGASLQLSHFVYVNNSELMELAANTDTESVADRYTYNRRLNEAFQLVTTPRQDIISCMVYMKNGDNTYLKDKIVIPDEVIKEESWYLDSIGDKNAVKLGSYDTSDESITYARLKGREFILAAALSPGVAVDKSGKIEVIAMFTQTRIGNSIREYNKNPQLGTTVITDENNHIIYGSFLNREEVYPGENSRAWMELKGNGVYNRMLEMTDESRQKLTCVVSVIEETGWKIITYVEPGNLTASFNRIAVVMILIILALFFLFYMFSSYFLKNIVTPVHSVVEGFREVETGNLETELEDAGQSEIRNLILSFNHMVKRLKYSIAENEQAREKKHEAEMKALQSQINPHFLVNTLNSIRFMAQVSRFEGIRKMAEALINILTCSFRQNTSLYSVREELAVLDSYIYLMKIRYSDGFEAVYDIDEDCYEYKVPRLILQPIVENSIVHGFSEMEDMGLVKIGVKLIGSRLCFTVEDNGKGMTGEQINNIFLKSGSEREDNYNIGIENVYSRLKLRYGEGCSLTIESRQGLYTRTLIKLPVLMEECGNEEGSDSR